jgi:hypothetical protein
MILLVYRRRLLNQDTKRSKRLTRKIQNMETYLNDGQQEISDERNMFIKIQSYLQDINSSETRSEGDNPQIANCGQCRITPISHVMNRCGHTLCETCKDSLTWITASIDLDEDEENSDADMEGGMKCPFCNKLSDDVIKLYNLEK